MVAVAPRAERSIDQIRYPIDDLGAPAGRHLVETCRDDLARDGACALAGFLTAAAVSAMASEAAALVPLAHTSRVKGTVYLEAPDRSFPEGHPRRTVGANQLGAVAYDLIPRDSYLRAIYESSTVRAFLAAVLGLDQLHPYADPLGALNVAVMSAGDELAWHFDQTDFVVSLALVSSEQGGDFEYVPHLRTADDERYDAVAAVLAGDTTTVRRLPMTPGTMVLFEGRHALHRVTRVAGSRARLVALLGFDARPGTTSTRTLRLVRYGREA